MKIFCFSFFWTWFEGDEWEVKRVKGGNLRLILTFSYAFEFWGQSKFPAIHVPNCKFCSYHSKFYKFITFWPKFAELQNLSSISPFLVILLFKYVSLETQKNFYLKTSSLARSPFNSIHSFNSSWQSEEKCEERRKILSHKQKLLQITEKCFVWKANFNDL